MNKILIVEDEDAVRGNLEDLLKAEGFGTLAAKNGLEGYKTAMRLEPDLIISDIRMPQMDGFELLEKLQENPVTRLIPFIFLTARADFKDLRKGMTAGADDYIMKPYQIDDVLSAINLRLKKKDNYLAIVKEFKEVLMKRIPHELRTPLVGILGLSDFLYEDVDEIPKDEIKVIAESIKFSGKRLHRRIEKFLTYTELLDQSQDKKNESIKTGFELEPNEISSKLLNKADEFHRRGDLSISIEKAMILTDCNAFYTMLIELTENSLKFSEKGTPIVISGVKKINYYEIKVIDKCACCGKILPEKIQAFNKFGKEDLTDEGIGMGLAIVKKIIELCEGEISFNNPDSETHSIEIKLKLA